MLVPVQVERLGIDFGTELWIRIREYDRKAVFASGNRTRDLKDYLTFLARLRIDLGL